MQVFKPGLHALQEGEELDYDRSAYDCLHKWSTTWPCLRCACIAVLQTFVLAIRPPCETSAFFYKQASSTSLSMLEPGSCATCVRCPGFALSSFGGNGSQPHRSDRLIWCIAAC